MLPTTPKNHKSMKKLIFLSLLFTVGSMALFAQNNHKTVFSVEAGGTYYYSINDNDLKTWALAMQ